MNPPIPTSWSELLASLDLESDRELLAGLPERAEGLPQQALLASVLPGASDVLTRIGLAAGPMSALAAVELGDLLPRALRDLRERDATRDSYAVTGWLTTTSTLLCFGMRNTPELSQGEFDLPKSLVDRAAHLREGHALSMAFHSLAVGLTPLVERYLGAPPSPASTAPGVVFGFDAPGFVRYMAAAWDRRAAAAEVHSAFLDHVQSFPMKLAANTERWHDLLCAARAYFTLFERQPLESVGERLHRLVLEMG